jgi:regulator of protease activity HflC (stomatin/prohibitin superfamily)
MDDLGFSLFGFMFGGLAWFTVRHVIFGFFTINQNERAVKTAFGRAERLHVSTLDNPMADSLRPDERERYKYPQVRVIRPGGPYFKWPWERVHKVAVATMTLDLANDPEDPNANRGGTMLEAVTKDQLNIGLVGQLRYRLSEQNLYAVIFGVKRPLVHVLAYFISILRQKIASFEAPEAPLILPANLPPAGPLSDLSNAAGVSINDLRKNLRKLNEEMDADCLSSSARYGILLDASLITGIDPPAEVESALAAINTAHNHVGAEISLAQASADQKIVQSRRAVEIETLNAQAEVEPLLQMAGQLKALKDTGGPGVLLAYVRNVKLSLFNKARAAFLEMKR